MLAVVERGDLLERLAFGRHDEDHGDETCDHHEGSAEEPICVAVSPRLSSLPRTVATKPVEQPRDVQRQDDASVPAAPRKPIEAGRDVGLEKTRDVYHAARGAAVVAISFESNRGMQPANAATSRAQCAAAR